MTSADTDRIFRVRVQCDVQVRAKSQGDARAVAEVAVREACEYHPLVIPSSPFVFDADITRNSFLAGKPARVVNE